MATEKRIISGYEFADEQEYDKAKKEAESVLYIKTHTDLNDEQQVLKLYNKASDMKMFKTVIGYEFMHQLRAWLQKKEVIEPQYMKAIPIVKAVEQKELPEDLEAVQKVAEQYRMLYEDCKYKRKLERIVIGFLAALIVSMIAMVYFNYSTYDENAILDKYSNWEAQLQEREDAVKEREKSLGIEQKEAGTELQENEELAE